MREGLEETEAAERGSLPSLLVGAGGRSRPSASSSLYSGAGCAVGPLLVLSSSPSLRDAQAEGSAFARVSVPGGWSVRRGSRRKAMDCTGGHLKTCLLAASVR